MNLAKPPLAIRSKPYMIRQLPIALTTLRVVLGPIMIALAWAEANSLWFVLCLSGAFLSDYLDGAVARRLGIATAALRRYDSIADSVFYVCVLAATWILYSEIVLGHLSGILVLVALELARYVLDFVKFGREASYHLWSAKGWGVVLFGAFVALFGFQSDGLVKPAIALGILSDLEGLLVSFTLPVWAHDVPTLFHAYRIRKAASASAA